jgi:hypothetical protein
MPLLKAKLMGTKSIFIAAVALGFPVSVFAEVLASGSVYFDSPQSYADVKRLAAQGDNRGIAELIAARHVSQAVPHDLEVSVPAAGPAPYGLVEFRFPGEPTPHWALPNGLKASSPALSPTEPVPGPNPRQAPSPASGASDVRRAVRHGKRRVHHRDWRLVNRHQRQPGVGFGHGRERYGAALRPEGSAGLAGASRLDRPGRVPWGWIRTGIGRRKIDRGGGTAGKNRHHHDHPGFAGAL